MAIAKSIVFAEMQADGRRYVCFQFVEASGKVHLRWALLPAGVDVVAKLTSWDITPELIEDELRDVLFGSAWDTPFVYMSATEAATKVRELFKASSREECGKIARRILEWITNGRFTDVQIRTVFGLTNTQWTTLKTKMQNLSNSLNAIEKAAGE